MSRFLVPFIHAWIW